MTKYEIIDAYYKGMISKNELSKLLGEDFDTMNKILKRKTEA